MTYQPDFLDHADELLHACRNDVAWHNEVITTFGKTHYLRRRVAWYGEPGISYRYSGADHTATGWPQAIGELNQSLNARLGRHSNFVLLNHYPDARVGLGWHRDNERGLTGPVVTVSLGATRRLRYRETTSGPSRFFDLVHGSVLVMDRRWYHTITTSRSGSAVDARPGGGERISLTFRELFRSDCT